MTWEPTLGSRGRVAGIQRAAMQLYGVSEYEMLGATRDRSVVRARHVAMYVTREVTDLSLPAIGQAFNRDHTTVLHAIDRVNEDPVLLKEAAVVTVAWRTDESAA